MEVTNTTAATGTTLVDAPAGTNPKGILGKDDFLMLLLTELKYQDPTEPMDSEKILSQTSQLATLEASENTNKALEGLAASLQNNMQFSTIAAIGKTADTGSNAIVIEENGGANFELYFPHDVQSGTINILDQNGNTVSTIPVTENDKGVYAFEWDGRDSQGNSMEEGFYYVEASYTDRDSMSQTTRMGAYPIESVRFEEGEALVKLGSSYVPFSELKEIYE
ncbi:MAG: FlgD immunoglobulin-like domain containing protein [Campylobacterota bacterium]|nr:FlgD immunoglobulin-like domain containing protein [Campylobacterota bacterium]